MTGVMAALKDSGKPIRLTRLFAKTQRNRFPECFRQVRSVLCGRRSLRWVRGDSQSWEETYIFANFGNGIAGFPDMSSKESARLLFGNLRCMPTCSGSGIGADWNLPLSVSILIFFIILWLSN